MERSTKAGLQLDFYPRKMLFLFPRRCIRTIGISREEIEDVTSRSEGSAGRGQTSPADIRAEHVRLLRFSSPRRDASSISSLSAALLSARTCARQYRSKRRRETARNGDSISPAHVRSFESQLSPLLCPPPGEFVRVEEKGIEGGRWFCTARKIVFDDRVLTSAQKRKENKEIVRRVNVEIVHTKM